MAELAANACARVNDNCKQRNQEVELKNDFAIEMCAKE